MSKCPHCGKDYLVSTAELHSAGVPVEDRKWSRLGVKIYRDKPAYSIGQYGYIVPESKMTGDMTDTEKEMLEKQRREKHVEMTRHCVPVRENSVSKFWKHITHKFSFSDFNR